MGWWKGKEAKGFCVSFQGRSVFMEAQRDTGLGKSHSSKRQREHLSEALPLPERLFFPLCDKYFPKGQKENWEVCVSSQCTPHPVPPQPPALLGSVFTFLEYSPSAALLVAVPSSPSHCKLSPSLLE